MDLKAHIKAEAKRLGFLISGITLPQTPPHYHIYRQWLEQGRHGTMDYLAREEGIQRRADPRALHFTARSILCLAAPYPPLSVISPSIQPAPLGKIAAYACTLDYHQVLPPRMDALAISIEHSTGKKIFYKSYTDSAAILERDFAMLAGLGWIGRNTCLINPQMGSFLLLGEVLLDIDLEPDPPFEGDYCGTCQRCMQACPTGCILPDRTLDARRCIAYLTIENKGAIPPDLRKSVGEWVFGCDICQQVCPWNRHAGNQDIIPQFYEQPFSIPIDLREEVSLSPAAFNQKFKHSPILRAKRGGYLRNIAVVLGNSADPHNLPALQQLLLGDAEALVRGHAAWAVGELGTPAGLRLLAEALQQEKDEAVLQEISAARRKF